MKLCRYFNFAYLCTPIFRVGLSFLINIFGELMGKQYRYLFFDLDGTLTDSARGIVHSAQYALSHFGIEVDNPDSLNKFVGPPLEDSFREFYHFSVEEAKAAVAVYRERYVAIGIYENNPYPGVEECLQNLRKKGFCLVIATSKMKRMADIVLETFRLKDYFEFVGGRDDDGALHSKADVIRHIIRTMGLEQHKSEILMIGDRKYDIAGAHEAGIDAAGVLFGYGDKDELTEAGADYLISDYGELVSLLTR